MKGLEGKMLPLLAGFVVLGAGVFLWPVESIEDELSSGRVAVRSESMGDGAFRWSFDAADAQGKPLETVFYTEEWKHVEEGGAVEVTVRLYETPAEGRMPLQRVSRSSATSAEFVLTCICPENLLRSNPGASCRIRFCGQDLGTWNLTRSDALTGAFPYRF